jgi:S-methylmethionine-dependent homocysteine/selenocysteine methylase
MRRVALRSLTHAPIIMDGGMGSELELRGYPVPEAPWWSAWNLKNTPDAVAKIHSDYAAAGATIHTTNTFRTKRVNIGAEWEPLTRVAYSLCRGAVPPNHLVAGSISPVSHCYRPAQSPPDAHIFHREMAALLSSLGVDILLCETFAAIDEAFVALSECVKTGTPTWTSFTSGPKNDLLTTEEFANAAKRSVDLGAECVLINCTPALAILPYLNSIESLPVPKGVLANAGNVEDGIGWNHDACGAERYSQLAKEWRNAGADIIGGCCGIRPAHIRAVAQAFSSNGHKDRRIG